MFKLTFITLPVLFILVSCANSSSEQSEQVVIPVVSLTNNTSSSSVLSQSGTLSTQQPSSIKSVTSNMSGSVGVSEALSPDTKKLIELQKDKGPNAFLELNCSKYDSEGYKFCSTQKALVKKFNDETITWEETLSKGPDYIKSFDCKQIANEYGQRYCLEYQSSVLK